MHSIIDNQGGLFTNVIVHPTNGISGAIQDNTAFGSNGFNATRSARKVIIESIFPLIQSTGAIEVLSMDGTVTYISVSAVVGAATPRTFLPTPIEIDGPVAFRLVAGLGVFDINWRYV